ncbi:MAG: hypothetical protein H6607_07610 [Flavobacteriales bacterium]|nr:hypothetical protein [Flavobacteriales bacterium]
MKKLIPFVVLVCLALLAKAQESSKYYLGFNAADMLFRQNGNEPTLVFSRMAEKSNMRLQFGYNTLSGEISRSSHQPNSNFSGRSVDTTISNSPYERRNYTVKFAYLRHQNVFENFRVYGGIEPFWGQNYNRSELNMDVAFDFGNNNTTFIYTKNKTKSKAYQYGLDFVLGVEYDLNERFKCGIDLMAKWKNQTTNSDVFNYTRQSSSFNPSLFEQESSGKIKTTEISNTFYPLGGLFLLYRI